VATDNQENENNTAAPSLSKRGAARRRVTCAGVGVLSTLSAHGAMATTSLCTSPSNWAQSLGVVNSHVPAPKCRGLSAAAWLKMCTTKTTTTTSRTGVKTSTTTVSASGWPGVCGPNTMFSAVFYVNPTGASCPSRTDSNGNTVTNYQAGSYYCATLYDLLKGGQTCDTGSPTPGKEFVAAYLNIAMGYIGTGALKLSDLQNIWYELQMSGLYHATGTITWDAKTAASYLNQHINIVG
jgi:hypothetical protein